MKKHDIARVIWYDGKEVRELCDRNSGRITRMKRVISICLAAVICFCALPARADYITITLSPTDRTCRVGETVEFETAATGDGITYRWQTRSASGGRWVYATYPGHNGPVLRVTAEGGMNGRQFRCVITDANGSSAATVPATLTVVSGSSWQQPQATEEPGPVEPDTQRPDYGEEDDEEEDYEETDPNGNVSISSWQDDDAWDRDEPEDGQDSVTPWPEGLATLIPTVPVPNATPAPDASFTTPRPSEGSSAKSVTVMLYLNGADLETEDGSASADIAEILKAGVGKNVNVIIETLGTRKWKKYGIASNTAQRWRANGSRLELVKDRLGRVSVADPEPLADFISWTAQNYPADRYMLLLWNHGGGAVYGYGTDEWNEDSDDSLTMDELQTALKANPGVHFDFIGMDACLMGSLEVCMALTEYCDYTILSEDFESALGWDYTAWLKALERNPAMSTAEVGKIIVDDMIAANKKAKCACTLAVIDESRVAALFKAWTAFAYANESALLTYNYSTERESNGRAMPRPGGYNSGYIFGGGDDDDDDTLSAYFVTDIMAVASNAFTTESQALEMAIASAIVYSASSSADGLTGLGVTLPYGNSRFYGDLQTIFTNCGIDGEYVSWLKKFVNATGSDSYYDYGSWDDSWGGWDDWFDSVEGDYNFSIWNDEYDDWDRWNDQDDGYGSDGDGNNNVSR